MKGKSYLLFLLFLLLTIAGIFCLTQNYFSPPKRQLLTIDAGFEIEPKFLIVDDSVFFSATGGKYFSLYRLHNRVMVTSPKLTNVFNPIVYKNSVIGLRDNNGDDTFYLSDKNLQRFIGNKSINFINTFKRGTLILIMFDGEDVLYSYDITKNTKTPIIREVTEVHSICHSQKHNFLVINYDNNLTYVNIARPESQVVLFSGTESNSLNPWISGEMVFFSDNSQSEFYRIYITRVGDRSGKIELLYKSNHDLRMPKYRNGNLYFVEILNSEYLLRMIDLNSSQVTSLTRKGVVYNYDFYGDSSVIYSYCDFNTPKSLITYNVTTNTSSNLTGKEIDMPLTYKYIPSAEGKSSAYAITPLTKTNGVILFIHPGLRADFSPRWEATLMNLAMNGYTIISPNYPMSTGYGKLFSQSEFFEALADIDQWRNYILKTYRGYPIYYLSSSSGNILMEQSLKTEPHGVRAAVSIFGVPNGELFETQVPTLYILGGNDKIVNYTSRYNTLRVAQQTDNKISIVSFPNEGHWFRNQKRSQVAVKFILNHFQKNVEGF